MANREIGEVSFSAKGKDWTLRYGSNALCELEAELGQNIQAAAAEMMNGEEVRITTVRAVLWAGLTEHHEGIALTHAGQLLDALGVDKAGELIGEAIALAFPEAKPGNPGAATGAE